MKTKLYKKVQTLSECVSSILEKFSIKTGQDKRRSWYMKYLTKDFYSADMFNCFINYIFPQINNKKLIEESILEVGDF